jgi:hypothetical protein
VHKTANVIAKLPKSQQPKAKRALQEIWMAEMRIPTKSPGYNGIMAPGIPE